MIDEYTFATYKSTDINMMCDGTYVYPTKNGNAMRLADPYIVICANAPPEQVYPNMYPTIVARFQVINVSQAIHPGPILEV